MPRRGQTTTRTALAVPGAAGAVKLGGEAAPAALCVHPVLELVPEMQPVEYASFRSDVADRGVLDPLVVTPAGEILDGRHRHRAATDLGLAAVPIRVESHADPGVYVLRSTLARRHLSASQRATVAVELDQYTAAREAGRARRTRNLKGLHAPAESDACGLGELATRLAGVSDRTLRHAAYVHRHDRELFAQVKAGRLAVNAAANRVRAARRDAGLDTPPLPEGAYDVILADPPWRSATPDSDYAPERHYPTMPLSEICALSVPAAKNAVLFLWSIIGQRDDADAVIDAWNFTQKDEIVWHKLPGEPADENKLSCTSR